MDIKVLNENYDIIDLVQSFVSFIWTERYSGYGDFELVVPAKLRGILRPNRHIYLEESDYLMIIDSNEKVETEDEDSDEDLMKVIGRSGESLLENRLVTPSRSTEPWTSQGTSPGAIVTWLVRKICIDATGFSPFDRIENLTWVTHDFTGSLDTEVEFNNNTTLYDAVKDVCDAANMGFRMHFNLATKMYEFKAYLGVDRTGYDTTRPLIFDEMYETLSNSQWLKSTLEHKNVAYVSHNDRSSHRIVYPRNTAPMSGRVRKVLYVDANDIEEPTNAQLDQRGREELAKHRVVDLFDGEAVPNTAMVYGANYHMGDIGVLRDEQGDERTVIVAEHTWTYDENGLRSYPTFKALEG